MRLKLIYLFLTCLRFFATSQEIVTCMPYALATVRPGDTFELKVNCSIQPGWYIYAPTDGSRDQGVIETAMVCGFPTGFVAIDKIRYPASSGHGRFQVFEGSDILISQTIHTESSVKPGKYFIKIKLIYQSCTDKFCLAPRKTETNLEISVR